MMRKETVSVREYSFSVVFEPAEEGGYVVTCPALPAVVTQGETLEEARAMAADAIHLVLESLIEEGLPVPEEHHAQSGREPIRETVTVAVDTV